MGQQYVYGSQHRKSHAPLFLDSEDFDVRAGEVATSGSKKEAELREFQAHRTALTTRIRDDTDAESAKAMLWLDPHHSFYTRFLFRCTAKRKSVSLDWYFIFDTSRRCWTKVAYEGDFPTLTMRLTSDTMTASDHALSFSIPRRVHNKPEAASGLPRLLDLPQELRDALLWDMSKDSIYVDIQGAGNGDWVKEWRSIQAENYRQHSTFFSGFTSVKSPLLIFSDGNSALRLSCVNRQLRDEYDKCAIRESQLQPLQHIVLVSAPLTEGERALLRGLESTPLTIMLWLQRGPVAQRDFDETIAELIDELPDRLRGSTTILALYPTFWDLEMNREPRQYYQRPVFGPSNHDIANPIRLFAVQKLHLQRGHLGVRKFVDFVRVMELGRDRSRRVVATVRNCPYQLICALFRRHSASKDVVDDLLWHLRTDPQISPQELELVHRSMEPYWTPKKAAVNVAATPCRFGDDGAGVETS